jgi:hypothetical protein
MIRIILITICLVIASGCATDQTHWTDLQQTAILTVSKGLQQTQFAQIGQVQTPEGLYHVAVQHLVLTGMPSPRGQSNLLLFDNKGELVASYSIISGRPLWCEGSRIYCWGTNALLSQIPRDPKITKMYPNSAAGGNVIDFSKGIHKPTITREKKYGSSGGIDSDPWKR